MTGGSTPWWHGRVALVIGSTTGGVGQHVAGLAQGLAGAGADVTVCGPAATEDRFGFTRRGARFVPVELPANPRPGDLRAVLRLRRALADAGAQVVHAHGYRAGFVAALARSARAAVAPGAAPAGPAGRWPLVVTLHNAVHASGLRGRVAGLVERVVARSADVTLGVSADLVRRAAALGAPWTGPAVVVAPPLPVPRRPRAAVRRELGAAGPAALVLSVGRLHPQKRHDLLVAAAGRWRGLDPAPVVAIAGTGPCYLALAAQISAVRARVNLLGHRDDVSDLLAAADLAVVTSAWEGRQMFAQEVLRAAVPLVATAVGGTPDLVGDAALLVPAGDVDAVDAAVRRLLSDPALRARYARRGLARAASWPTEADAVGQVQGIYAGLAPVGAGTGPASGGGPVPPAAVRRGWLAAGPLDQPLDQT